MLLLKKIRDDLEQDLLTSDYPFLKNKFKKIIFEVDDKNILDYQRYFGYNNYNVDLSNCFLIDKKNNKKQLNFYLFNDDIITIKIYNNTIILYDNKDKKIVFKKQYFIYNFIKSLCNKEFTLYYYEKK